MKLWAYKLDNTIPGCGDPDCCGDFGEEIEWFFYYSEKALTAEEFLAEHGGGTVLEIRQATDSEFDAYASGENDGYDNALHMLKKRSNNNDSL